MRSGLVFCAASNSDEVDPGRAALAIRMTCLPTEPLARFFRGTGSHLEIGPDDRNDLRSRSRRAEHR